MAAAQQSCLGGYQHDCTQPSRRRVLAALNAASLTQEQFSEPSGVTNKYYQLIEIGKRIDLRLSTLGKLAGAYRIGVHEQLSSNFPKARIPAATRQKASGKRTQ